MVIVVILNIMINYYHHFFIITLFPILSYLFFSFALPSLFQSSMRVLAEERVLDP
jgi:hypothetical protein